jgi:hypothetical protein
MDVNRDDYILSIVLCMAYHKKDYALSMGQGFAMTHNDMAWE